MKKLGFGLMRLPRTDPNDPKSIDIPQMCEMVDRFIARGFTYFDTAWMYCNGESERAVKAALVSRHARGTFTLATKLHVGFVKCEEDRDRIFNAQREKTGADYFDYYLLHSVERGNYEQYEKYHCFEWLAEKKAAGLVRHMGFSYHDNADLLDRILTEHPEMEFVQLQLNYLDWESEDVQSRRNYEVAVKHGKKVVVMEPVRGGLLARVPERAERRFAELAPGASPASFAIRFAASLKNVMVVLSGMSDLAQLDDNTGYMADFRPLDEAESEACRAAADSIRESLKIPCTGCSYCTDGCPQGIRIPACFTLYNKAKDGAGHRAKEDYRALIQDSGAADTCVGCGQCEGVCPQHLPIRDLLKQVAEQFK